MSEHAEKQFSIAEMSRLALEGVAVPQVEASFIALLEQLQQHALFSIEKSDNATLPSSELLKNISNSAFVTLTGLVGNPNYNMSVDTFILLCSLKKSISLICQLCDHQQSELLHAVIDERLPINQADTTQRVYRHLVCLTCFSGQYLTQLDWQNLWQNHPNETSLAWLSSIDSAQVNNASQESNLALLMAQEHAALNVIQQMSPAYHFKCQNILISIANKAHYLFKDITSLTSLKKLNTQLNLSLNSSIPEPPSIPSTDTAKWLFIIDGNTQTQANIANTLLQLEVLSQSIQIDIASHSHAILAHVDTLEWIHKTHALNINTLAENTLQLIEEQFNQVIFINPQAALLSALLSQARIAPLQVAFCLDAHVPLTAELDYLIMPDAINTNPQSLSTALGQKCVSVIDDDSWLQLAANTLPQFTPDKAITFDCATDRIGLYLSDALALNTETLALLEMILAQFPEHSIVISGQLQNQDIIYIDNILPDAMSDRVILKRCNPDEAFITPFLECAVVIDSQPASMGHKIIGFELHGIPVLSINSTSEWPFHHLSHYYQNQIIDAPVITEANALIEAIKHSLDQPEYRQQRYQKVHDAYTQKQLQTAKQIPLLRTLLWLHEHYQTCLNQHDATIECHVKTS